MHSSEHPTWDLFLAWPVWVVVGLMQPFVPEGHLFRTTPTLTDFARYSTPLNRVLGFLLWWHAALVALLIAIVLL